MAVNTFSSYISYKMRGSLVIIGFFVVGTVAGVSGIAPSWLADGDISFWALCALMFFVGMSVGGDTEVLRSIRRVNPRLMLLPLVTVAGTLGGTAAAGAFMPHRSLPECMAVGSGFGYYSLSSIFITEYKGAELGTVALLANISRELITLLLAPLLARRFGPLAPIASGGATTMDTTLPIITRASGSAYVMLSVYHGFLVDFSVPFLVTFFCSL